MIHFQGAVLYVSHSMQFILMRLRPGRAIPAFCHESQSGCILKEAVQCVVALYVLWGQLGDKAPTRADESRLLVSGQWLGTLESGKFQDFLSPPVNTEREQRMIILGCRYTAVKAPKKEKYIMMATILFFAVL